MNELALAEITRHKWADMECGCGHSAAHLEDLLRSAVNGEVTGLRALDGHAFVQSILMPPAPAVSSVAMAMLSGPRDQGHSATLSWLILSLAAGEEDGDSVESGFYWKCHETIRDGLWAVYREVILGTGFAEIRQALDVAEIVDWDEVRFRHYSRIAADRLT